jgi:hypothetical protein
MRRTCFHVLGLISSNPIGGQLVEEHGWESVSKNREHNDGVAVPKNIMKFVNVRAFPFVAVS